MAAVPVQQLPTCWLDAHAHWRLRTEGIYSAMRLMLRADALAASAQAQPSSCSLSLTSTRTDGAHAPGALAAVHTTAAHARGHAAIK